MLKKHLIAGIELGSTKVATLIAQVEIDPVTYKKDISIVGVASVDSRGIKKGQIVNIEEAVDVTISSVEAAERMAGYNLDRAYVALGGAHVQSQNSHGVVAVSDPDGEIKDNDVNRVVEAASAVSLPSSREIVHILPREYVVDGESGVKDPIGMSGVRLEVQTHLVTASVAAVKNLKKALNEVGVKVVEFVFDGLAAGDGVLTKTEKELGCVVVDIGGGTTSIAAYTDGALAYSGVIPIGASNVTNDLAIGLRVSLEQAEKIKVLLSDNNKREDAKRIDSDKYVDFNAIGVNDTRKVTKKTLTDGIIKPRLNEIFAMVKLQIDKENLSVRVPSGVILTGGGAMTFGVGDSAKKTLSLPVRIGKPKGISGLIDDVMNPTFATPVGLITYAANQEISETAPLISSRFKLPSKDLPGKIIEAIKEMLP